MDVLKDRRRKELEKVFSGAERIIQSFAPGEVTSEQAMMIAQLLCSRLLKDQYPFTMTMGISTRISFSTT